MSCGRPTTTLLHMTGRLREVHQEACRVLVVTTFDLDDYVLGAIRAGAAGFLLKDQAPDDLVRAVRILAAGEGMVVAPRATARLLREFVTPKNRDGGHPGGLTDREIDVVRLLAQGLSNDDIAARAFVSRQPSRRM